MAYSVVSTSYGIDWVETPYYTGPKNVYHPRPNWNFWQCAYCGNRNNDREDGQQRTNCKTCGGPRHG